MDDENMNRIQAFLAAHGASLDTLPKARVTQFEMANTAIQARKKAFEQAQAAMKQNSINVSTISADTGISRKTFYNNELLRLFVEEFSVYEETAKKTSMTAECENLRGKNKTLAEQIHRFVLRDINIENLKHENAALSREIIEKNNRIRMLEQEYERVQAALVEAKAQIPIKPTSMIPFPNIR